MKTCLDCRFCLQQDLGYSNWTVCDSEYECLQGLNPALADAAADAAVNKAVRVSETCPKYSKGERVWFDVEGETTPQDYRDDPEVYALLIARGH